MAAPWERATLVCPACRRVEEGALRVQRLHLSGAFLTCGACLSRYPIVDGVPLLFSQLSGWLQEQGPEVLSRADLPEPLSGALVQGTGGILARNRLLRRVFEASREGPFQAWVRGFSASLTGEILEIGCGAGLTGRADILGLDYNYGLLRARTGPAVCADAMDPPFLPDVFDTILLLNVLDACRDPGLVLAQASAMLKPGGLLVVSCAYAFSAEVTPSEAWFTDAQLRAALDGRGGVGPYQIPHQLQEALPTMDWPLRYTERTAHVHRVDVLLSRKLPAVHAP